MKNIKQLIYFHDYAIIIIVIILTVVTYIGALIIIPRLIKWFHLYKQELILIGITFIILTIIQLWRDIAQKCTYQGLHITELNDWTYFYCIKFYTFWKTVYPYIHFNFNNIHKVSSALLFCQFSMESWTPVRKALAGIEVPPAPVRVFSQWLLASSVTLVASVS